MRVRLEPKWTDVLVHLPESGMGYQRVRVRLQDGRVIDPVIAHNAEVLEIDDRHGGFTSADIERIDLSAPK